MSLQSRTNGVKVNRSENLSDAWKMVFETTAETLSAIHGITRVSQTLRIGLLCVHGVGMCVKKSRSHGEMLRPASIDPVQGARRPYTQLSSSFILHCSVWWIAVFNVALATWQFVFSNATLLCYEAHGGLQIAIHLMSKVFLAHLQILKLFNEKPG